MIVAAASAGAETAEKGQRPAIVARSYTHHIALKAYCSLMDRLLDKQLFRYGNREKSLT
jgi:hypothetical protein